ncbi:MAG: choice-of-anchor S family protein [Candidatus Heimdallarchaeota archaeon]
MKKIIKISFVILIMSSFLLAQNTQGAFMVSVGDQVKFKLLDSEISVEFGSLAEAFPGFLVNNTLVDIGTSFKLNVEEITATELDWNSTIGTNTMFGTCPLDISVAYSDIAMLLTGYNLMMLYDPMDIYTTGEIDAEYLDIFMFPPFVDTAPITWTMFETIITDQSSFLGSIFPFAPEINSDATFSDANDTMSAWWYFDFTVLMSPSPLMEITVMNDITFSYEMTTGILQEVIIDFQYNGTMDTSEFTVEMDQHLIQSDQSDFVEFLDDYKWYFIGGGGGLIVLIFGFAIIIRVIKRR